MLSGVKAFSDRQARTIGIQDANRLVLEWKLPEEYGIKVYVFKNIYDYDKAFGTHRAALTPEGESAALNAPSFFDSSSKPPRIAVFENLGDGTHLACNGE